MKIPYSSVAPGWRSWHDSDSTFIIDLLGLLRSGLFRALGELVLQSNETKQIKLELDNK